MNEAIKYDNIAYLIDGKRVWREVEIDGAKIKVICQKNVPDSEFMENIGKAYRSVSMLLKDLDQPGVKANG